MKVFGYCRVSGKGQIEGDGFPRQRAAIEAHAATNGMEVVQYFEERGVSGKTEWEDRPAWLDMIASLNGVRTIVIERLDRLARDLGVQEHILRDLKKRGITLVSTAEPDLGDSDATRVLFRQIMAAIAQYDRAMVEAKLRSARGRIRAKEGRCEGRKPFGYREGEMPALELMTRLRSDGEGYRDISDRLNALGYQTRDQKRWHSATVARILKREGKQQHG